MGYRPIKTERAFPELKCTVRLRMLPAGEHNVRIVEARRQRVTRAEGESRWGRAHELEATVWPQEKMGLDDEANEALDHLRERMEKEGASP